MLHTIWHGIGPIGAMLLWLAWGLSLFGATMLVLYVAIALTVGL